MASVHTHSNRDKYDPQNEVANVLLKISSSAGSTEPGNVLKLKRPAPNDIYQLAFEEYRDRLTRFVSRALNDQNEVSDVVQDVYVRLVRYEHPEKIENIQAFLFTTASNLMRDRFRRAQTHMADKHVSVDDVELLAETSEPHRQFNSSEIRTLLQKALNELDDHCRYAFVMHRFENQTHAQIAKEMGTTVGIVRKYISIALVHCTKALKDHL